MRYDRNGDYAFRTLVLLMMGIGILFACLPAAAEEKPNDSAALAGLDSVKTVFLINKETATATAGYLKGIRATQKSLAEQGVAPTTVLVFLGKAVQFITTEPSESIGAENQEALASIASTTAELKELGVRMEVCSAATKHFEVDNSTLLPVMDVVGNGFISLIGWQSKGYVSMTF